MIVSAKTSDGNLLTELALTSKAFWGYDAELVETLRNDLTVTSKMIEERMVFKFLHNDKTAGFYMLNPPSENKIELEMLFVLPEFIGKGIGKKLVQHSFEKVKKINAISMTLLADPNAEQFYKSQGFKIISKKESSVKNRFLPVMQKDLRQ